jgi:hypothetical protein
LLPRLIWFQQIDDRRDARPILERLSEMRRLDRQLICELGDTLRNSKHACDLLGRQLELPYRRRQQVLAGRIQCVGRSCPAACFRCATDQLLIWLAASTAPVGHALLGAGVRGFDEEVGSERSPKRGPSLPGDEHLGATPAGEVGVAGIPADTGGRDVGGHAVVAGDATKRECIGQSGAGRITPQYAQV